ncbi:MAG: ABC transporter substrate-binding protein [Bradyrhizobiaceae bacterium]|nr:MAG: ABC transporter substrate-binding protein [Bradyrhizobiaceae bacterium]
MRLMQRLAIALVVFGGAGAAHAEMSEISIARQPSLGHLPLMIMQDRGILEKNAAKRGIPNLKVNYLTLAGGAAMNDALLSNSIQFAAGGVPPLIVLWAKTKNSPLAVKAVAAMNSMPLYLNMNKPNVRTLRDLTDSDKIGLPAVKVSIQAILLQMAAEKEFGPGHQNDLDKLTVTLSHPDGMRALLSSTEVTGHFTAAPIQEMELAKPGVHTLLNSYKILGNPSTFNVVWTSSKFREENPKIYEAFVESLDEAIGIINADKTAAAKTYVKLSGDAAGEQLITSILNDPQVSFTSTPQGIGQYVGFMSRTGMIKEQAGSWKDLFFPNMYDKNGS